MWNSSTNCSKTQKLENLLEYAPNLFNLHLQPAKPIQFVLKKISTISQYQK